MIGYIRNPDTWQPVQTVDIISYELPIETAQGESGKATIAGELTADYNRYILSIDGLQNTFKIAGQTVSNVAETTLTLEDEISILEGYRAVKNGELSESDIVKYYDLGYVEGASGFNMFSAQGSTQLHTASSPVPTNNKMCPQSWFINEDTIATLANWLPLAGVPYSECVQYYEDNTTAIMDAEKLLRAIRSRGAAVRVIKDSRVIRIGLIVTQQFARIDIAPLDDNAVVIPFNDGHNELLTESYNDKVCSHVILLSTTTIRPTPKHIYLDANGNPTYTKALQINGYTTYAEYDGHDMSRELLIAAEIFSQNEHSHKIEFASDRLLHIGQKVKLLTSRGVIDSVINRVMLKSNDNRYYYACGDLPVTATDKIKAFSWLWGGNLPNNPSKGTLFFDLGG